jgi:Protein of unknown function with HXXEE motif
VLREGVHVLGPEVRWPFIALIVAQAAHSVEEYVGGLYDSFPPARFISGLISSDLERGFFIANLGVVTFGAWCALWPIRQVWPSASLFAWLWVGIETINGIGHPLWSLAQGGYTPGVATAPLLLVLAIVVARGLRASGKRRFTKA